MEEAVRVLSQKEGMITNPRTDSSSSSTSTCGESIRVTMSKILSRSIVPTVSHKCSTSVVITFLIMSRKYSSILGLSSVDGSATVDVSTLYLPG